MAMKYVAMSVLLAVIGMFSGCLIVPHLIVRPEPVVPEGVTVAYFLPIPPANN